MQDANSTPSPSPETPAVETSAVTPATAETTAPVVDDGLLVDDAPLEAPKVEETVVAAPELAANVQPAAVEPRGPNMSVIQDSETFLPLTTPFNLDEVVLPLAADTFERTREILAAQPNLDLAKTAQGQEWIYYFNEAQRSVSRADVFQRTVTREGSQFRQAIPSEKGLLGASAPRLAENTEGHMAVGETAVLRVRALMGLGTTVAVPMWHSGFWITLKAPSDAAFLELHRRLTEEKINLGRQTYGLAFANNSVFFAGTIMDFVMNHVHDTTLKNKSIENIRSKLSSLDIPLAAWALACTIWPKGFQYARPVPDHTKGVARVIKEKLNLAKLLFVDHKSLTEWQIAHMAQRHGNLMTDDSVQKYRDEFTRGRGRTVEIGPNLSVTLKVPQMDDYLNNGQRWINNIVAMVDRAFSVTKDGDVRDEYIMNQGKATNFRQFSHWVESVQAQGVTIVDQATMEQTFDVLSEDDKIRDRFFDEVRKFMEDAAIAVVCVPTFEEADVNRTLPGHPHLLPLDVLSVFFTLLVQRVNKVMDRE